MTTTTYHNSPVKGCDTCIHFQRGSMFHNCGKWSMICLAAVTHDQFCGYELKGWQPRPPKPPKPERRSVRQWLCDLLWKKEES